MELKETIDKLGRAFEEFKTQNDKRLDNIEQGKGIADIEANLEKLNSDLDELGGLKDRLEKAEIALAKRRQFVSDDQVDRKSAIAEFKDLLATGNDETRRKYNDQARENGIDLKAINIGTGADGGFAVPEVIEQTILDLVRDFSPMREVATVRTISTSDYKELHNIGGTSSGWVGETAARPETNSPQLAEVAPPIGEIYAEPQATQVSLEDLFFDVEGWINSEIADEFALQEGASFISGTGTNQPEGLLTGAAPVATADATRAYGTLQYVPSGAAAAVNSGDALIDVVYTPKRAYRRNAAWQANRATLATIRKLKDGDGDYLWAPGLANGEPATLLGYRVVENEDMPDIAADAFPLAFGDWARGYMILDRVGISMLRDPYTNKPFIKFYTRKRVGGIKRDTNAIKLLKVATS
ncbi:MAG: phage major capsid protein [Pseudomonadota bacterium]